ncbi:MAG TPA: HlyD family secretion protein, partial [Gammaproteobacteria bacterium]|nr:HlyD family secretion protein [Gammaproteobacteria bacterium]
NAYVKADKALISAQVSGPIATVTVKENQPVSAGAVLFRLDETPFKLALDRAKARLQEVRSDLEALKASYGQKHQELRLAESNAAYAEREFHRQSQLAHKGLTSQEQLDETRHRFDVAQKQVGVLTQDLARILANLDGDAAMPVEDHPRYLEAKAERDQAALDLQHAAVRAPFDGVASKTPEPGVFVKAGDPVMSVVAARGVWIKANFKETQLTHVHPGQSVTVRVDTYPGHEWHGRVTSISQATGAEFSILPPQNASGNWVKVVQWIPVRVAIDNRSQDLPLRAGMSTEVTVDTGYQRPLPGAVARVASWLDELVRVSQAKDDTPPS